jgi:protein-tyrosine phosphatase
MTTRPPNYRDVGESLSLWLTPSPIASGRLLRGGKVDPLTTAEDLGHPKTIINLRKSVDPTHLSIPTVHLPAIDGVENYKTSSHQVRRWVSDALTAIIAAEPPVYVHCTAGRDRTGVVIAAALVLAGVAAPIVIEEYMLSEGSNAVAIRTAIDGVSIGNPKLVDVRALQQWLYAR